MAYTPTTWVDGTTPVNATNLNKLEAGVQAAAGGVDAAIPTALVDAKGDLIVASAPDAVARLGPGADGQVLTADAAQALGLRWATPAAGGAGATDISYEGLHVPASAHDDGDIVIKDGVLYLAQRTTTQTPDPSLWGAVGPAPTTRQGELTYAELTVNVNVTAITEGGALTILNAPAITVDGVTPIVIEFSSPLVSPPSAGIIYLCLFDGATSLGFFGYIQDSVAGTKYVPVRLARRLTPSAGSHSYSLRAFVATGTGVIGGGVGSAGANVPAFIRISLASPAIISTPGHLVPVSYGTTLPTAPVDGQEAILVDSLTNPSYQWRFRWNAGNASAYKWEFVGGAPLQMFNPGLVMSQGTASSWVTVSTPLTIPRAGVYQAFNELFSQNTAFASVYEVHHRFLSSVGGGKTDFVAAVKTAANQGSRGSISEPLTLAAAETLVGQISITVATATNFKDSMLSVLPVRVA